MVGRTPPNKPGNFQNLPTQTFNKEKFIHALHKNEVRRYSTHRPDTEFSINASDEKMRTPPHDCPQTAPQKRHKPLI
ncbi:MAG: hypothetical protein QM754_21590 [Tepidisphaeraceae bacterium]